MYWVMVSRHPSFPPEASRLLKNSTTGVGGQPFLLHLLLIGDSHGQLLARGEVVVLEDLLDNKNVDVSLGCRSGQHGGEGTVVVLHGVYLLGLSIIIDHLLDLCVIIDHLRGLHVIVDHLRGLHVIVDPQSPPPNF